MSRDPTASDLVQIALAALQPGVAPAEPRPTGGFSRCAVLQVGALACIAAALGCGLVALWMYASPMLGAAGGLLVVSAVLCSVALAAFVFGRRAGEPRAPSPVRSSAPGVTGDTLLAGGSRFFRQHPVLALAAAVFAGVLMGGES